ncbi:PIR protein [Plasmodium vivax]|uniref:VIR protein n=1 Tax=Plasmodium vivax TaxID=5855 RepID=A0A565A6Y5_PLAVI|nr:PIR protein [Plasmodium vivax]
MDMGSEDLHNYDPLCNNIGVNSIYKEKMIPICKKYLRFLDTYKTWRKSPFERFDISILLNYWLYGKLKHIYHDTKNYEINIGFSALQLICNTFISSRSDESYYKKYVPDWELVNHTDWEKRKKLYDYYVDYKDLSYWANKQHSDKCKYYKQIQEKQEIFNHFDRLCESNSDECPKFYQECSGFNPKKVLSPSECQKEMDQPNDLHTESDSSENDDISYTPAGPIPGYLAREGGPGLSQFSNDLQKAESTPQISGIVKKVSESVLFTAPVLLTTTALYRYTPLGPWIRRLRGGRTNNMNAMDTFPYYTQEAGDIYYNNDANYISYQPI